MTSGDLSQSRPPGVLSRLQIDRIAQQEAADEATVAEALRRMQQNPQFRQGEVRSPAAFFRGIVRGVLADKESGGSGESGSPASVPVPALALHLSPPALPPPKPDQAIRPADRLASRMALRARSLFAQGHDAKTVRDSLLREFPSASPSLVAWAVTQGLSLHRALSH